MLAGNFKELEFAHKDVLTKFFRMDPPQYSELNFTTLTISSINTV